MEAANAKDTQLKPIAKVSIEAALHVLSMFFGIRLQRKRFETAARLTPSIAAVYRS
jgi:hypothetical protein